MLLTTTDVPQGREVERYLGIVTAEVLGVSIHTNMSTTMILVTAAGTAVKLR
jgi:uncharacterized protein YbjQ (UPF0145 family)